LRGIELWVGAGDDGRLNKIEKTSALKLNKSIHKMTITIPDNALAQANIKPDELLIELAVYLYDKKALSWGKARKLSGLDEMSFRRELSKRDVYMHFSMEDLEKDLKNLGIR